MLSHRPRRNRRSQVVRDLIAETDISQSHLVYPIFVGEDLSSPVSIQSMPGIYRWDEKGVIDEVLRCRDLGIFSFAIFPAISEAKKDPYAKEATNPNGLVPRLIKKIKNLDAQIVLFTDVALDPYNSDGHDGILKSGKILNDETVEILKQMACVQADAGADFVSPSDMMDGRIGAIRKELDKNGFTETGIMSYAAKYASNFYGPFRDALDSAPKSGDKKTYQMDFRNSKEALHEMKLDFEQGADILMVKPALSYLDIIHQSSKEFDIPIAAYNVSGEYSMLHLAAQAKMINLDQAMIEVITSIHRAGADIIFTYFAKHIAMMKGQ